MEYKISVTLNTDANHTFESADTVIGRAGEGSTTRMEITIPTELTGCSVYLDFEKPNGEKLRTPQLDLENSKAVYDVVQYLLTDYGEIKVQAVCITDDSKIWKSSKKTYHILKSINAIDDIPEKEDFMTEAQKLLDELREANTNGSGGTSTPSTTVENIPDYVVKEAENVIKRVIDAQGKRTFTFAVITDMHYGNSDYTDGVKHACQALKYIDSRVKLDAVAVLGDYTDGYPQNDNDKALKNALGDFKDVNTVLDSLRFTTNLRLQGNHDYYDGKIPVTRRLIQSYSDDVVWGDRFGGYYYKDFDEYKIRVICPNTNENNQMENKNGSLVPTGNISMTDEQYQWFMNSLDVSSKEDATDWQILILSHQPLDWYTSLYIFCDILNEYKSGGKFEDDELGISYDFNNKNSATLIGNIHGHIHNLLTDYIHNGNVVNGDKTGVWRMATPEACIGRANNSYKGSAWEDTETYEKTKNTATDTSFVVYCIDLDTKTINAVCYGAGYHRTLNYITGEFTKIPKEPVTPDEPDEPDEPDVPDTPDVPEGIVNLLDTVGYTDGMRFSASNGAEKTGADGAGCVAVGFIDISGIGWNDKLYAYGADFNNDNNDGKCVIVAYDKNKNIIAQGYIQNGEKNSNLIMNFDGENRLVITRNGNELPHYIRFSGFGSGANVVVAWNIQ